MRNSALSLLAAFALMISFAALPASADDSATGRNFSVSLTGLADFANPGDTLQGQISVTIPSNGPIAARKQVFYTVTIDTPVGDATVLSGDFHMRAGRTRNFPFSLPIEENAVPGIYSIRVQLTVDGESLSVGHTLEIGGKR
jgi:hypothetical protein